MSEPEKTPDPGARPVDEDAPDITQHVGEDRSTERAGAQDAAGVEARGEDYDEARGRAETTGATSFSVTTRRP